MLSAGLFSDDDSETRLMYFNRYDWSLVPKFSQILSYSVASIGIFHLEIYIMNTPWRKYKQDAKSVWIPVYSNVFSMLLPITKKDYKPYLITTFL